MGAATKVRERPILFNGEMVQAILEGRKTQTRRVVKPQPEQMRDDVAYGWEWRKSQETWFAGATEKQMRADYGLRKYCPYGKPGDELWVRETWCQRPLTEAPMNEIWYKQENQRLFEISKENSGNWAYMYKWRPSIHMPRWASRIQLRITDVRVERVQSMAVGDLICEGFPVPEKPGASNIDELFEWDEAFDWFQSLWDSINVKRGYGWDTNPWVWVIEFERA